MPKKYETIKVTTRKGNINTMKVEISNSEYLKLLMETNPEHQDLYWCLRTKCQLRKMQTISGFNLQRVVAKVEEKYKELNENT